MSVDPRPSSLQRQAYLQIKEMVTTGELAPGDAIVERQLAAKLGVSRIPIREALVELEKEGLVKRIGSRTRIVSETTLRDAVEIFQVREIVEGMAARLAARRISEPSLDELRELADRLDRTDPSDEDEIAFHGRILRESGNSRLIEFAGSIYFLSEKVCFSEADAVGGAQAPAETQNTHRLIVDALADRDPDRAEEVARAHIREGREDLLQFD